MTVAAGEPLIRGLILARQANQPVLLHGRHGIGKSQIFEETTARLRIGLICLDLSLIEPGIWSGYPWSAKMERRTMPRLRSCPPRVKGCRSSKNSIAARSISEPPAFRF